MNIDETTLIEIQDYINALDEKVGLKPETITDIRNAISKHKSELNNLRLGDVVKSFHFTEIIEKRLNGKEVVKYRAEYGSHDALHMIEEIKDKSNYYYRNV